MDYKKKSFRYYYWFSQEYFKKHLKIITLSFFISLILIVSFISLSPYLITVITPKKEVIGYIGNYNETNLPEEIISYISNSILVIGSKGNYLPVLAKYWEIKKNGQEYLIHLKSDLYWNDGKNFQAKDFNLEFKDVKTEIVDKYLIKFTLNKPLAIFPSYLTKPILKQSLIGVAGLYKVDQIKKENDQIKELYLSPNKTNLPTIVYKFYENENQMITAYKLGEIRQMKVFRKNIADIFSNWKNTEIKKTIDYSRLLTVFFNLNNKMLKEKEIRQAIDQGIDREKLAEFGTMADSPISPSSWAYNANLKKSTYDLEAGREIFKNDSSSSSAELTISTFYEYLEIAEKIKDFLISLGIKVNTKVLSTGTSDFDLLLAYWNLPPDPDQYYFWHSTQIKQGNITGYKNLKVDKLLEDARNSFSLEDRKKLYLDFQKVIVDDKPSLFLLYPYVYEIKRK